MSQLHIEIIGTGKTIVLLHGWAMHSGVWRPFAHTLAQEFRVICVDLPGHGRSVAEPAFVPAEVAVKIVAVLNGESACWLGWSMGGLVALEIARQFPALVQGLILLASNPCFVKQDAWPGMQLQVLQKFAANLQEDTLATLLKFLALQLWGLEDSAALLAELRARVLECAPADSKTLQQGLQVLQQTDLRPVLAALACPVLAILGTRDALVPVALAEHLTALRAGLQCEVIPQAGHTPFLSHPEATRQLIAQFMHNL